MLLVAAGSITVSNPVKSVASNQETRRIKPLAKKEAEVRTSRKAPAARTTRARASRPRPREEGRPLLCCCLGSFRLILRIAATRPDTDARPKRSTGFDTPAGHPIEPMLTGARKWSIWGLGAGDGEGIESGIDGWGRSRRPVGGRKKGPAVGQRVGSGAVGACRRCRRRLWPGGRPPAIQYTCNHGPFPPSFPQPQGPPLLVHTPTHSVPSRQRRAGAAAGGGHRRVLRARGTAGMGFDKGKPLLSSWRGYLVHLHAQPARRPHGRPRAAVGGLWGHVSAPCTLFAALGLPAAVAGLDRAPERSPARRLGPTR